MAIPDHRLVTAGQGMKRVSPFMQQCRNIRVDASGIGKDKWNALLFKSCLLTTGSLAVAAVQVHHVPDGIELFT